jgi:hypothetical protein
MTLTDKNLARFRASAMRAIEEISAACEHMGQAVDCTGDQAPSSELIDCNECLLHGAELLEEMSEALEEEHDL